MKNYDKPKFIEAVEQCLTNYGPAPNALGLESWWVALCRYELHDIRRALVRVMANSERQPKPVQVVKLLDDTKSANDRSFGCPDCRHQNPAERVIHWLQMEHIDLKKHLQAEFPEYYDKHHQELGFQLEYIAATRRRHSNKFADESGNWLPSHEQFRAQCEINLRDAMLPHGYKPFQINP